MLRNRNEIKAQIWISYFCFGKAQREYRVNYIALKNQSKCAAISFLFPILFSNETDLCINLCSVT